jgi:hypothetical protein
MSVFTVPGNPNFKDGINPHVWKHGENYEWYACQPTPGDFEKIAGAVDSYLEMFQEPVQSQERTQEMS